MSPRAWSFVLICAGLAFLLTSWKTVTRLYTVDADARARVISQWSSSGTPEKDKLNTKRFMFEVAKEAEDDPDIDPVQANLYFSGTASRDDVIFVSFLAGNPPDIVSYKSALLPDAIAAGQIRPLDDLIERENRIRERLGLPDFISGLNGGEQSIVRFKANPRDWRIRRWLETGELADEAARMLNMHGKIIGFNPPGMAKALTYNGRIFEEAAKSGGKYAVLVDAEGKAKPPATWQELREFARLITEWGIETYGAGSKERPYGMIVQGVNESLFSRIMVPLAATAGSQGFDFTATDWVEGLDVPVGRYEYDSPAFLGAFTLIAQIKADGSVKPGTENRPFEVSRALVSQGRAAMLIDGWHAAMIGAQRNPAAKKYMGSAAIPVPYRNEAEKAALTEMIGMEVGLGKYPRDGGSLAAITCITTGSEAPEQAWDWLYRNDRFIEEQKPGILDSYGLPGNRTMAHFVFDDPSDEWREFRSRMQPFQFQAWNYVESTSVWPSPPPHGSLPELQHWSAALREYFIAVENAGHLPQVLGEAKRHLTEFTAAINQDIADKFKAGLYDPSQFGWSDWNPVKAGDFYIRQLGDSSPELDAEVAALRGKLSPELQGLQTPTELPGWPLLLMVFGLIAACVALYVIYRWYTGLRDQAGGLKPMFREARNNWHAYVFVGPAVLGLFVFIIYPAFYQVYLSFHSGTGQTSLEYVGADHYTRAMNDRKFWGMVVPNTAKYMVIVAVSEVAVGLVLASLLNLAIKGISVYRTLFFLPMVVSMSVIAVVFLGLLGGKDCVVNQLFYSLGFYASDNPKTWINWITDPEVGLYTLMAIGIWHGLPYNTILCLAGLQSIPKDLYEAAKVDGAGVWSRFWRITIPQIAPILLIILFNSLVGAARHFGNVYIMTKGENNTEIVSTYVFKAGFEFKETSLPDIGYASTLSIIYAGMLALLIVVNTIYVARRMKKKFGGQHARAAT